MRTARRQPQAERPRDSQGKNAGGNIRHFSGRERKTAEGYCVDWRVLLKRNIMILIIIHWQSGKVDILRTFRPSAGAMFDRCTKSLIICCALIFLASISCDSTKCENLVFVVRSDSNICLFGVGWSGFAQVLGLLSSHLLTCTIWSPGTGCPLLTRTLVMERNIILNNNAWKTFTYSLI
jgi:hypothetical protein